jgi:hypothetical protein
MLRCSAYKRSQALPWANASSSRSFPQNISSPTKNVGTPKIPLGSGQFGLIAQPQLVGFFRSFIDDCLRRQLLLPRGHQGTPLRYARAKKATVIPPAMINVPTRITRDGARRPTRAPQ